MYKHIQLDSRGALSATPLENLGQIVVVCGKNNSGKSTLLQAIYWGKQYLKPDELDTRLFAKYIRYPSGSQWEKSYEIINIVPKYKDYWTEDDARSFVDLGTREFAKWQFGSGAPIYAQDGMMQCYRDQLKNHRLVSIPPKRLLELKGSIQTSAEVLPTGQGLLNFLFRAANQFENDAERRIYDKIKQAFYNISEGYNFIITTGKDNNLQLSFRSGTGQWFAAEVCGLGLQDLLVLLYFIVSSENDILLVEEPESHIHPAMQRKLLRFCKEVKNKQFFFSTHSSVFLDLTLVDTILHTEMTENGIEVGNDTSRAVVLDSLGYSITDNLVSDLIILVEGPKDKPIIEEFLQKLGLYASYSIKIWPLGGDIMDQLDLTVFAEKYKIIALIDKDPKSQKVRGRFKRKCQALGIEVHQLRKRAIENYFSLAALRGVFGEQVPNSLTNVEPDELLERQIGFSVKLRNYNIVKLMEIEDIKDTDLFDFLMKVKEKLES